MKIRVESDEYYPFYFFTLDFGEEVEVFEEEYKWLTDTLQQFEKMQDFLKHKYLTRGR